MSRKTWFVLGAGFGLVVPVLLNVIQHFGPWRVRPTAYFLFRPGLLALVPLVPFQYFWPRLADSEVVLFLLVMLANAGVFGAAAYVLRRGFMVLIAVLLITNYVLLPPSDAKLERQFAASKPDLERLVQKASQTSSVVRIGNYEIKGSDGRVYGLADRQAPLSPQTWSEYRETFKKVGMKEGLSVYTYVQPVQVQFLNHTIFGKVGPIGTLYGYVYCPAGPNARNGGFLPCRSEKDEYDIGDYRHKRIASEWFIVEYFETRSTIN